MTLIASLRAKRGAIILADSQETVKDVDGNEWKYSVLKLEPTKLKGFEFVIAGGGDGDRIDAFIERFKRKLEDSKVKSLSGFRGLFEKEVPKRRWLHFTVAACFNGQFEIWKSVTGTLIPIAVDRATLMGFDAHMFQHVADNLYSKSIPAGQMIAAGLRVLELARNSVTCIDVPYSGVIVSEGGLFALDNKLLAELTQSVTTFGNQTNRVVLACSDTTMRSKDFAQVVNEFKQTAEVLRHDYLQTIAKLEFEKLQQNGIGYGIPMIPANSVTSFTLDSATGKTEFNITEEVEDQAPKP